MSDPGKSKRTTRITGVLIGLFGFVALVCWVLVFGSVSGTEIAPGTLEMRSFWYYQIPGIQTQITKTRHRNVQLPPREIAAFLLPNPLPSTGAVSRDTWDLATGRVGFNLSEERAFVIPAFVYPDVNFWRSRDWVEWSKEHNAHATIVWPLVQRLAIADAYWAIPELMRNAEISSLHGQDAAEFRTEIIDWVIQSYRDHQALADDANVEVRVAIETEVTKLEELKAAAFVPRELPDSWNQTEDTQSSEDAASENEASSDSSERDTNSPSTARATNQDY